MIVDLLLSKHNHNGAAAQRYLLVLGAAFDARKLCTAPLRWLGVAGFSLSRGVSLCLSLCLAFSLCFVSLCVSFSLVQHECIV